MDPAVLISVEGLSFRYEDQPVLRDVSVEIRCGEVLGLVGPNGAGKSTLIELLAGGLLLQSGQIRLAAGLEPTRAIGYCPQEDHLWGALSCTEQLTMMGRLYGLTSRASRRRADDLLARLGLTPHAHKLARQLSGGMRRRLSLALALIQEPAVVVLDEPEAGLDPGARAEFRGLLRQLAQEQERALLIATHHLQAIEKLADQVALLHHGKLLDQGSCDGLIERYCPARRVSIVLADRGPKSRQAGDELLERLREAGVEAVAVDRGDSGPRIRGTTTDPLAVTRVVNAWTESSGWSVESLEIKPGELEDVFLTLTGEGYERQQ